MAFGTIVGTVGLIDTNANQIITMRCISKDDTIMQLEWTQNCLTVVTLTSIVLLENDLNEIVATLKRPDGAIGGHSAEWNSDFTKLAAVAHENSAVLIYDAATVSSQKQTRQVPQSSLQCEAGQFIYSSSYDWCPFRRNTLVFGGQLKGITFWDSDRNRARSTIIVETQRH